MYSIIYILPEIFLSVSIMVFLMMGVFIKKSFNLITLLTILSLIFTTALVLNQSGDKFSRGIQTVDKSFLKDGDVLVKIDYSDLNFKDAMILKNGGKLIKEYPRIPGIDFSGTVDESNVDEFKKGDSVSLGFNMDEVELLPW